MIKALLKGIIKLIVKLVSLLLLPIDSLIDSYLPSLSSAFDSIGYFFQIVSNGIGWVISASGIPSSAIAIIVATMTFKLTVPILVSTTKLAIKWYDKLKP